MTNRYPSRYSNSKLVSAAQYITELVCENKAKYDGLDLHAKFWQNNSWSKHYRNQIPSANKLLKKYHPKAIIKALQDNQGSKIYSLRAQHLVPIIEKYQKIIDLEAEKQKDTTNDIEYKSAESYRKYKQKPNILSKLEELDDES